MVVGGPIRKAVFWTHLTVGVIAGLVILMMSVTGVILTYERQIVAWIDKSQPVSCTANCEEPAISDLYAAAVAATGNPSPTLTVYSDPARPVLARAGRGTQYLLDPYDGTVIREGYSATDEFFGLVMRIHRWFALEGDARGVGRAITGASNLAFLGLLLSGIYLWLPQIWTKAILRARMLLNLKPKSGKARDFNWHHAFSFWSFIPLFFLITTATVFYYGWANEMVYGAFGETPPSRGGPSAEAPPAPENPQSAEALMTSALSLAAAYEANDWHSVAVTIPQDGATARFSFDRSIGGQPAKVVSFEVDRASANMASLQLFSDRTPGQQARFIIRFLHTGEVLGFFGQTIAGLASLAACFLVWSGLALAWRRLVRPLLRKPAAVGDTPLEEGA